MPAGRPSKYNSEFHPVLVEYMARNGMTDEAMAAALSISTATLYTWRLEHPEFLESLKRGKDSVDDQVKNALLKRALGYPYKETKIVKDADGGTTTTLINKEEAPNVGAAWLWLKNRRPEKWKEHPEEDPRHGLTLVDRLRAGNTG